MARGPEGSQFSVEVREEGAGSALGRSQGSPRPIRNILRVLRDLSEVRQDETLKTDCHSETGLEQCEADADPRGHCLSAEGDPDAGH